MAAVNAFASLAGRLVAVYVTGRALRDAPERRRREARRFAVMCELLAALEAGHAGWTPKPVPIKDGQRLDVRARTQWTADGPVTAMVSRPAGLVLLGGVPAIVAGQHDDEPAGREGWPGPSAAHIGQEGDER